MADPLQTAVRGACGKETCRYPNCCVTVTDWNCSTREATAQGFISALRAAGLVIVPKAMKPVVDAAKEYMAAETVESVDRALARLGNALAALEAKEKG